MDLIPEELKAWLLQSVPGIILLGAIGSVIATFLVYLVRLIVKSFIDSKERIAMRFIYGYWKSVECGERFRDLHAPHTNETRYLASIVYETGMFIVVAVMLILSLALSLLVYVMFAIEKPIALSTFIGATIFFANMTFKHGLYITSLLSQETINTKEAIEKAQPKTFPEWEKATNNAGQPKP